MIDLKLKAYWESSNGLEHLPKEIHIDTSSDVYDLLEEYKQSSEPLAKKLVESWQRNGEDVELYFCATFDL